MSQSQPPGPRQPEPQPEVDAYLASLVEGVPAEVAAQALAAVLARAATRLHTLSRAQASARKGAPDWPAWAALQNASRSAVLQGSTCRDLAKRLPPADAQRDDA